MKTSPGGIWLIAILCLAGSGLIFVPREAAAPFRSLVRDALRPGQGALYAGLRHCREWVIAMGKSASPPGMTEGVEEELQSIRLENRRLELRVARLQEKLQKLSAQQGLTPATGSRPPLAIPQLIEASILGEETASLRRGRKLLSTGANGGIVESALVLDDTRPLVDVGGDAQLSPGDAAYAGRIVIGKIAEVGRYSSTLRLVTDPAYTGGARLARRTSRGLVHGAEGTLVGDGSELCRLKHVSDPVNVGDEVFTGGTDGLVKWPMYYGKVVRAELEPGASEWSVWVKPAASDERLETVLIQRRAMNPDRILAD